MILDTLVDFNMWHCNKGNHNKIWGYFLHGDNLWTFWGGVGKAWTFKAHGDHFKTNILIVETLSESKIEKGYASITQTALDVLDATWRDRFNDRYTYFLLKHSHHDTMIS
jgi:hypothetical protein